MDPQNTPEYLTVAELAELLRLKERKIYDLAASGEVPCSRATGKLLFPAREIRAWIASHSSGGGAAAPIPRPRVLLGSHDPLLDWAVRESRCGLATYFDGSLDGVQRFAAHEGIACGLHVHDAESDSWNIASVEAAAAGEAVLIGFARRWRGLVLRGDGPQIASVGDLAGHSFAPRQPLSGTESLFRQMAAAAQLDLSTLTLAPVARTETEAVQSVARGEATATFGLETVARDFGLRFVPVIEERFDLLVDRRAYFDPPLQTLFAFCRGEGFRAQAQRLGGYDLTDHGQVRWNG